MKINSVCRNLIRRTEFQLAFYEDISLHDNCYTLQVHEPPTLDELLSAIDQRVVQGTVNYDAAYAAYGSRCIEVNIPPETFSGAYDCDFV